MITEDTLRAEDTAMWKKLSVELYYLQFRGEIEWFMRKAREHFRLHKMTPGMILEIGCFEGANTCMLSRLLDGEGTIIGIDNESHKAHVVNRRYVTDFVSPNTFEYIVGDSTSPDIVAKVSEALDGRKIDLLFIDGNHGYEMAKADFINYTQFLSEDGIVALHDIVKYKLNKGEPAVGQLWAELSPDYPFDARYMKYMKFGYNGGIGILYRVGTLGVNIA